MAIQLIGVNQFARYVFDDPANDWPGQITVTVKGASTTFDTPPPFV